MARAAVAVKSSSAPSFMGVDIEINHECNRTCAYCPNSNTERRNQGRMSEELFLVLMKQLREIGYRGRISYHFYNEPLLSPDLDRFVGLTKEYLPRSWIELYTNGTLLDEPRLRSLLALGVDKFTVTKHHGSPVYPFEALLARLEPEVRARIKFQDYRKLILTSRGGLVRAGTLKAKPPLDLPCLIPSTMFVVTVNGNVVPCFEDYHEQNVMGSLRERPLLEIWNSEKYTRFRADLRSRKRGAHPVCRDCNCGLILM